MELKKVTLKHIADQLCLTQGTVSRGLRGDLMIKLATRKAILKTATDLGYYKIKPNTDCHKRNPKSSDRVKGLTKNVTIYDIAKKLDISSATVSRALNPTYNGNKNTREKILEVALELGYSVNYNARNLRTKDNNSIRSSENTTVTIYTLAKMLGLSAATVSRSFTKNAKTSAKTKARVLQLAAELGFVPNEQARQLRKAIKQNFAVATSGTHFNEAKINIQISASL